jgi:hypothetical protein
MRSRVGGPDAVCDWRSLSRPWSVRFAQCSARPRFACGRLFAQVLQHSTDRTTITTHSAIGYTRVSGSMQRDRGLSLDAQRNLLGEESACGGTGNSSSSRPMSHQGARRSASPQRHPTRHDRRAESTRPNQAPNRPLTQRFAMSADAPGHGRTDTRRRCPEAAGNNARGGHPRTPDGRPWCAISSLGRRAMCSAAPQTGEGARLGVAQVVGGPRRRPDPVASSR